MTQEYVNCPACPNQGWYAEEDRYTGEPIQVQCEFCETEPNSVFNVVRRLKSETIMLEQDLNKTSTALGKIIERFKDKQNLHKDDCFAYQTAMEAFK